MLKHETVINRFIKTYGDIRQLKTLPCVIGKVGDSGLSFNPMAVYSTMLLKLPSIPKIEQKNPLDCLPEIKYAVDSEMVSWYNEELIAGFRVIDTKPFQNLTVTISNAILPIMVTREDDIGIFLSPHVDKITMKEALKEGIKRLTTYEFWQGSKFQYDWVKQFHLWSTLWLVETKEQTDGTVSPQRFVKCRNPDCNAEMTVLDYYRIHYEKHTECICTCNTWSCPMDCYRIRQRISYESKMRELSTRKRFWRRKFT